MSHLLALYDIPDDKLRAKVADLLQDRGLARIQRSVYLGRASPGRRALIIQELTELVGQQAARIHLIPLSAEDVDDILSLRTQPIPRKPVQRTSPSPRRGCTGPVMRLPFSIASVAVRFTTIVVW